VRLIVPCIKHRIAPQAWSVLISESQLQLEAQLASSASQATAEDSVFIGWCARFISLLKKLISERRLDGFLGRGYILMTRRCTEPDDIIS